MGHIYIFATILFASVSQILIKYKMSAVVLPSGGLNSLVFLIRLLFDPLIIASLVLTFLSGLSWMMAMNRFQLSYAYPYIGLTFVVQMLAAIFIFHEPVYWPRIVGVALIVLGIAVASRSM